VPVLAGGAVSGEADDGGAAELARPGEVVEAGEVLAVPGFG
jgi:hypothetical protein